MSESIFDEPFSFTGIRSISILIPVLNERDHLIPTVERLERALSVTVEDYEIIIINDGSTDGTAEIANELARNKKEIRAIHNNRPTGLGHVYAQGIKNANKNYFVYIPGDNTWPYRSFIELMGNLGKADIITSFSTNPQVRPFGRRVVSKLYTKTLNLLFTLNMNYYNGLTIYPLELLQKFPPTTFGFGFQSEILLKMIYSGYSFIEVGLPIDERTAGSSKAVNLKNIISVLRTLMVVFFSLRFTKKWQKKNLIDSPNIRFDSTSVKSNSSMDELGYKSDFSKSINDIEIRSEQKKGEMKIIITGASSGIGAAIVNNLSKSGHTLFVCSRNIEKYCSDILKLQNVFAKNCDVTKENEIISFIGYIKNHVTEVDALINCAGGFGSIGSIENTESSEWFETIKLNLFGPYLMIKHVLPLLKKMNYSKIINFSGGGAFSPFPNYSAYACSKSALIRLTETLASELAPYKIMVNAIAPGIIATPAHQATIAAGESKAGRLQFRRTQIIMRDGGASMAHVVSCVNALLSDSFRYLTGKTISANFDPWNTDSFKENILKLTRSDLYTLCRMNIVNLPPGDLRNTLSEAWSNHGTQI